MWLLRRPTLWRWCWKDILCSPKIYIYYLFSCIIQTCLILVISVFCQLDRMYIFWQRDRLSFFYFNNTIRQKKKFDFAVLLLFLHKWHQWGSAANVDKKWNTLSISCEFFTKIISDAVWTICSSPGQRAALHLLCLLVFKIDVTEAEKKWTSVAMPIYLWLQDEVPSDGWSIFIDS